MSHPNFFQLINIFSEQEIIGLQEYIDTSLVKDRCVMQQLLIEVLNLLRKKSLEDDWKEALGKKLYPKATNCIEKLDQKMSALKKYAEQYLVICHLQKNPHMTKPLLLELLQQRAADKPYFNVLAERENHLHQGVKDIHYYQQLFLLHHQLHLHPTLPASSQKDVHAEQVMNALDASFVLAKLRYSCELYAKATVYNKRPNIQLLWEAQQLAVSDWGAINPLFKIYSQLLHYHQRSTDYACGFGELIQLIVKHLESISKDEQIFLFFNLLNLASWRKRAHVFGFDKILYDLYVIGEKYDLFLQNKVFIDTLFVNVIISKGAFYEIEEAMAFIDQYAGYLTNEVRAAAICLSESYLHFFQEEYQEAIVLLTEFKTFKDTYYNRATILLISCYVGLYHQQGSKPNELDKVLSNFQRHLSRLAKKNIINADRLKSYKHFIKLVKGINMYIFRYAGMWGIEAVQKKKLLDKLNELQPIVNYDWLYKMINRL